MKDECLICGAPLEYLNHEVVGECAVCHKKEHSKTRCVKGHYVCSDCHTRGIDAIIAISMGCGIACPFIGRPLTRIGDLSIPRTRVTRNLLT